MMQEINDIPAMGEAEITGLNGVEGDCSSDATLQSSSLSIDLEKVYQTIRKDTNLDKYEEPGSITPTTKTQKVILLIDDTIDNNIDEYNKSIVDLFEEKKEELKKDINNKENLIKLKEKIIEDYQKIIEIDPTQETTISKKDKNFRDRN